MLRTMMLMATCGLIAGQFPHPVGVAPILGAILCASCFLQPRELWIVGLGGLLLRELQLGVSPFTVVRMIGIALVIAAVLAMKIRPTWRSLSAGVLAASALFHVVLTVGDWATGTCGGWPRTLSGFFAALASSAPYAARMTIGDALFAAAFLAGYAAIGAGVLKWKPAAVRPSSAVGS